MKIATYNVNSIRQRLEIVLRWLEKHQPDVLCLQETKVQDQDFPVEEIRQVGYHVSFRGMKGYNGVATISREEPSKVIHGLHEGPDNEDFRVIQTVIRGIPIINSYVPQGHKVGTDKYAYKLAWYQRFRAYLDACVDPQGPALWVGDLNVAPEPIDVYHPDRRGNDPDFHIDTRNAFKNAMAFGFVDVFRKLHPDAIEYTYWDYFRNAFERNFGWRIDHILATQILADRCDAVEVDLKPRMFKGCSDHTIVWAHFRDS